MSEQDPSPPPVGRLEARNATLHEAMVQVLKEAGRPLTAREIAMRVNERSLYSRRDGARLPPGQIELRARHYPHLFMRHATQPVTFGLVGWSSAAPAGPPPASRPQPQPRATAHETSSSGPSRPAADPGRSLSPTPPVSDEQALFAALARLLPRATVLHNAEDRAVERHLLTSGARFLNHHWDQGLPAEVASAMDLVFTRLQGRREGWREADLARYLDGFITHRDLGPCLVEFDEEQHFSPFRLASLEILGPVLRPRFDVARYMAYCLDPACFRQFWRKHRLPSDLFRPGQAPPRSALEFTGSLLRRVPPNPATRYYAPVKGFPFVGGRIAQRAYYDALRDCYHLTDEGRRLGLRPVIRVAKYQVEAVLGREIAAASADELDAALADIDPFRRA